MNYLAHIYLSGENTDVQIGNFMGDAVKGSKFNDYTLDLKKGILLHRAIDHFTDQHSLVRQSKKRLHPRYNHYKGVLIDIFYDYFLAKNWSVYSKEAFPVFVNKFYQSLQDSQKVLPERIQFIAPKLIAHDWFSKYDHLAGIERVLIGMSNRIKHDIPLHKGIEDLRNLHDIFEEDFTEYFPLIQQHAAQELEKLHKQFG